MFAWSRRMNYTIFDPYKSDHDGTITTTYPPITPPDIDARIYIMCTYYYKSANPAYKSQYCHHVEPLEVALKTVGKL